jgi:hypothetical protein
MMIKSHICAATKRGRRRSSGQQLNIHLKNPLEGFRPLWVVRIEELRYGDVPPEYFQQLLLKGVTPKGEVAYLPSFDAS